MITAAATFAGGIIVSHSSRLLPFGIDGRTAATIAPWIPLSSQAIRHLLVYSCCVRRIKQFRKARRVMKRVQTFP
jgi:hypothetical protein